jgi:hypothetical protein
VRLHGTGDVVLPDDAEWAGLRALFPDRSGDRAIIRARVERLSSSCGFAVPFMQVVGDRETLSQWSDRKSPEELAAYQGQKNAVSIDGLPGLA